MATRATETCWLFVDDSNIWIEAQKAAAAGSTHLPKLTDRDREPRLRINIGKLADKLCKGRTRGISSLYGSRPPPNDTVWAAFTHFDFELHIFEKNLKNKEKEVDTEMASDLVERATELRVGAKSDTLIMEQKKNTIFVVITGDRDMVPPIRKVLMADIRVELWAWKFGLAKDYYRLCSEYPGLLSVNHLESVAGHIFFTNTKSTRRGKPDPAKTLVLRVDTGTEMNEDAVSAELSQLHLLFYTNNSASKTVIFVEFPRVLNIENVLLKARQIFKGKCTVLSWPEYANSSRNDTETALESRNRYAPLETEDKITSDADPNTEDQKEEEGLISSGDANSPQSNEAYKDGVTDARPGDIDEWETVSRSDPAKTHRRHQRQSQQCPEGIRCSKRGDCGYRHIPSEQMIFESYPGQDMRWWKTKRCNRVGCRQGSKCPFAHNDGESWCLYCKVLGHVVDSCQWSWTKK